MSVASNHRDLLIWAFDLFNRREVEAALALMHPAVEWPNGMEGGYVYGHSGVCEYWTRQWTLIDPHVEPTQFQQDDAGRVIVSVHQTVRDLAGNVLVDQIIEHIYQFDADLVRRMEIRRT